MKGKIFFILLILIFSVYMGFAVDKKVINYKPTIIHYYRSSIVTKIFPSWGGVSRVAGWVWLQSPTPLWFQGDRN